MKYKMKIKISYTQIEINCISFTLRSKPRKNVAALRNRLIKFNFKVNYYRRVCNLPSENLD